MRANKTLLQMKYARIIAQFAKLSNISRSDALAFFYHSNTYQLMREGIADMHCRGDLYLADELDRECKARNLQSL